MKKLQNDKVEKRCTYMTCQRIYVADDRTAVGIHERRILLSKHYSNQNISGVPGFEHTHIVMEAKFGTQFKSFYDDLESTGKVHATWHILKKSDISEIL